MDTGQPRLPSLVASPGCSLWLRLHLIPPQFTLHPRVLSLASQFTLSEAGTTVREGGSKGLAPLIHHRPDN